MSETETIETTTTDNPFDDSLVETSSCQEAAAETAATSPESPENSEIPSETPATTPGEMAEICHLLDQIEEAEERVAQAESAWNARKEASKNAKATWQAAVDELRRLVRTRKKWAEEAAQQTLFKKQRKEKGKDGNAASAASSEIKDDSWKSLCVAAAGFSDKECDALEGVGINTLGELQAKMDQHKTWWAKECKVNKRLQSGIEDTFGQYLAELSEAEARK